MKSKAVPDGLKRAPLVARVPLRSELSKEMMAVAPAIWTWRLAVCSGAAVTDVVVAGGLVVVVDAVTDVVVAAVRWCEVGGGAALGVDEQAAARAPRTTMAAPARQPARDRLGPRMWPPPIVPVLVPAPTGRSRRSRRTARC